MGKLKKVIFYCSCNAHNEVLTHKPGLTEKQKQMELKKINEQFAKEKKDSNNKLF